MLEVVDLNEQPGYEAISYVWGDENYKEEIICDGLRLEIPRNLAAVL